MKGGAARLLETVSVDVPETAVPLFENALGEGCETTGFFLLDEVREIWRVEGVRGRGVDGAALEAALALARLATGVAAPLARAPVEAEGWLARTASAFPVQEVGTRFAVRGTHLAPAPRSGRIDLVLDAGIAFGSGEHSSTRGCLLALEMLARQRQSGPVLDLGCGSAILAMAAARILRLPARARVRAIDIEPWSARVAAGNARLNGLGNRVRVAHGDGWQAAFTRDGAPYGLVFANILARPLCRMAPTLARRLAPGGVAILAGLLAAQARLVLAAHRRQGLVLRRRIDVDGWSTLLMERRA